MGRLLTILYKRYSPYYFFDREFSLVFWFRIDFPWILKRKRENTMLLELEARQIRRRRSEIRSLVLLLSQKVLIQEYDWSDEM